MTKTCSLLKKTNNPITTKQENQYLNKPLTNNIMFIKNYDDNSTFDQVVEIKQLMQGELLDEVTGRVYINELDVEIEGVPNSIYAFVEE